MVVPRGEPPISRTYLAATHEVKLRIHTAADAHFHDSVEFVIEPDCPFRQLRAKSLNRLGIPEKMQYRTKDVAVALGISTDLLRWRFRTGKYPDVIRDTAGRRVFSISDIERLAALSVAPQSWA